MNIPRKVKRGEPYGVMYDLWNGLIDYLASAKLVAGARISLQVYPTGTLISAARQTSSGMMSLSASGYDGPFKLTLEDGTLKCSGGWLNRNGISMDAVSELVCTDLMEGTVVIRSVLKNKVWSAPVLKIVTEPDRWSFPVGKLTQGEETGTFEVTQYPVCCAFILASEICIMSKIAAE